MTNQLQQICAGFETFPPASADACNALWERFPDFDLYQYVNLLLHTNGLGEVIEADGDRHMHNMLMLPIEEASRNQSNNPKARPLLSAVRE